MDLEAFKADTSGRRSVTNASSQVSIDRPNGSELINKIDVKLDRNERRRGVLRYLCGKNKRCYFGRSQDKTRLPVARDGKIL